MLCRTKLILNDVIHYYIQNNNTKTAIEGQLDKYYFHPGCVLAAASTPSWLLRKRMLLK